MNLDIEGHKHLCMLRNQHNMHTEYTIKYESTCSWHLHIQIHTWESLCCLRQNKLLTSKSTLSPSGIFGTARIGGANVLQYSKSSGFRKRTGPIYLQLNGGGVIKTQMTKDSLWFGFWVICDRKREIHHSWIQCPIQNTAFIYSLRAIFNLTLIYN